MHRRHRSPSTGALICEPAVDISRSHAVLICTRYMYAAPRALDGLGSLHIARSCALNRALATAGDAAVERAPSVRLQSVGRPPGVLVLARVLAIMARVTPGALARAWGAVLPLGARSPHALFSPCLLVCSSAAGFGLCITLQATVAVPAGCSNVGARDGMRTRRRASQGARGAVWRPRLCRACAPCVCCGGPG